MLPHPDTTLMPQALHATQRALDIEARAIDAVWELNANTIPQALELIASSQGHVVISGLGKSGHIGAKLAATWSSFGTPTVFMNSSEALHGDFGICNPEDVGVVISYSGRTAEVVAVAQMMKALGMAVIALSHDASSPIGQLSDVHLSIKVDHEADTLKLGPTASTAATLALGDALAAGLQVMNAFTPEDFRLRHPGGSLGKQLAAQLSPATQASPSTQSSEVLS